MLQPCGFSGVGLQGGCLELETDSRRDRKSRLLGQPAVHRAFLQINSNCLDPTSAHKARLACNTTFDELVIQSSRGFAVAIKYSSLLSYTQPSFVREPFTVADSPASHSSLLRGLSYQHCIIDIISYAQLSHRSYGHQLLVLTGFDNYWTTPWSLR